MSQKLARTNVNQVHDESMTFGQKVADKIASGMGSWRFIIIQTVIVMIWISGNLYILSHPFDIYPFILLNLLFSTQAAYAAPLIMMSQNRQASKDRLAAEADFQTNLTAKVEIETILAHIEAQDMTMLVQHEELLKQIIVVQNKLGGTHA
jgi:uncharacterized membrane protein